MEPQDVKDILENYVIIWGFGLGLLVLLAAARLPIVARGLVPAGLLAYAAYATVEIYGAYERHEQVGDRESAFFNTFLPMGLYTLAACFLVWAVVDLVLYFVRSSQ